jgi:hypothetical protein
VQSKTRAPDDFHLRMVVEGLVREGRTQRQIEAIVERLTHSAVPTTRRSLPAIVRRLISA